MKKVTVDTRQPTMAVDCHMIYDILSVAN